MSDAVPASKGSGGDWIRPDSCSLSPYRTYQQDQVYGQHHGYQDIFRHLHLSSAGGDRIGPQPEPSRRACSFRVRDDHALQNNVAEAMILRQVRNGVRCGQRDSQYAGRQRQHERPRRDCPTKRGQEDRQSDRADSEKHRRLDGGLQQIGEEHAGYEDDGVA